MMGFRIPPIPHAQVRFAEEALNSGSEDRIKDYLREYAKLPSVIQSFTGYALAAKYHLTETCGISPYLFAFYKDLPRLRVPFSWLGWAGKHNELGPAYTLNPECFTGKEITLYYADDDLEIYSPSVRADRMAYAKDLAKDISLYSSGLSNVHAVILPGRHSSILTPEGAKTLAQGETCAVAFTLDPGSIKSSVIVNGREWSAEETGGFVFVLPRAGEFDCTMGELFEDALRLPLRTDSYCMK